MAQVLIHDIQFDFESDDCYLREPLASQVTNSYKNRTFDIDLSLANDGVEEAELICDFISNRCGWCILDLSYTLA